MDNYRKLIEDRLAERLSPELRERYKQRREEAIARQEQNYQSPDAIKALADDKRLRAMTAGFAKAANKFGSVMGDGGPKTEIDKTMQELNEADESEFSLRRDAYERAGKTEDSAVGGLLNLNTEDRQNEKFLQDTEDYSRAAALRKQEDDPSSDVSRRYQELAKRMLPSGEFSRFTATQLKSQLPSLERIYQIDENRKSRLESAQALAASRADAKAERELIKTEKEAAANAKKTQNELETSIPGYEKTGQAAVRGAHEVEKLRTAAATQKTIESQLDQLIALQSQYGDYETGPRGEEMAALSSSIQLKLKELENLGVLNGPDLFILQKQIPDVGNVIVSRNSNTAAKLKQAKKQIGEMTANKLETSGYRRADGGGWPKTVRNPKTGETAQVSDADELAEARAEGFTQ